MFHAESALTFSLRCKLALCVLLSVAGSPGIRGAEADGGNTTVVLPGDVRNVGHKFWSNGFVAVREIDTATIHLHDRAGKRLWTAKVAIPGAARASVFPVTIWPDGSVAAGGGGVSADGARTAFLAFISPTGEMTRLVCTAPFVAQHLTVAQDGSLWAFGRVFSDWGETKDKPHMMVRKYARDGSELAAVLPRAAFPDWPHPSKEAVMAGWKDRVGFVTMDGEWVEISTETGEQVFRRKLAQPKAFRLHGAAYGPEGGLYLSGTARDAANKAVQVLARLDRASGSWADVTPSSKGTPFSGLTIVGAEGDSVVLGSGEAEVQLVPFARLR
ncbi:MAG: hypothetical protein IT164_18205 [Bryobacterales bacterium]|nr:hypothetical protein [Bryobacterales bacterium]